MKSILVIAHRHGFHLYGWHKKKKLNKYKPLPKMINNGHWTRTVNSIWQKKKNLNFKINLYRNPINTI